ncbi:hypothetical protein BVX99_01940 [bacterium F16]|nr:hypothetical protein BVX99_01940 [bacterium F16]
MNNPIMFGRKDLPNAFLTGTIDGPIQVVCGWCDSEISPGSSPASHGICPSCLCEQRKQLSTMRTSLEPLLAVE